MSVDSTTTSGGAPTLEPTPTQSDAPTTDRPAIGATVTMEPATGEAMKCSEDS